MRDVPHERPHNSIRGCEVLKGSGMRLLEGRCFGLLILPVGGMKKGGSKVSGSFIGHIPQATAKSNSCAGQTISLETLNPKPKFRSTGKHGYLEDKRSKRDPAVGLFEPQSTLLTPLGYMSHSLNRDYIGEHYRAYLKGY